MRKDPLIGLIGLLTAEMRILPSALADCEYGELQFMYASLLFQKESTPQKPIMSFNLPQIPQR